MRKTILNDTILSIHLQKYKEDKTSYISTIMEVFNNPDLERNITLLNKGRVVATLLKNFDHNSFLALKFDLPEILLGCQFLDAKRMTKQLIKKIAKIDTKILDSSENTIKKLKRTRKHLDDQKISTEKLFEAQNMSLSLSRIKMVKNWVRRITELDLCFRTFYDRKKWKELADLCHFCPSDFQGGWFLEYCFTGIIREGTVAYSMKNGDSSGLEKLYTNNPIPYTLLRLKGNLSSSFLEVIAKKETLRTVLWYRDEIKQDDIIASRLESGENIDLPYGKLVDIIMDIQEYSRLREILIRVAETKLLEYKLSLPSPVVVLCDASQSMDIAIRTSSIITSLLCAMTKSELNVFRDCNTFISDPPRNVRDSLKFVQKTRAYDSTSPASSLIPYLNGKKEVRTFIIITDQEENTDIHGKYTGNMSSDVKLFASTYEIYAKNVYPAKLIFITFGESDQMISALKTTLGSEYDKRVLNYNFDKKEPDLRRLDTIMMKLADVETKSYILPVPEQPVELKLTITPSNLKILMERHPDIAGHIKLDDPGQPCEIM